MWSVAHTHHHMVRMSVLAFLCTMWFLIGVQEPSLAAAEKQLDLNTATVKALQALPGIGQTLAKRIVDYRDAFGPFKSVEELRQVKGIGDRTLAKIRDLVTVRVVAHSSQHQP
ncbi:MAG: ComEA family DNA-binding protein [Nitrospirae bacterium]|nr:MAG: ComEA family DNA-binding protein [Nitrospirota bacterium]